MNIQELTDDELNREIIRLMYGTGDKDIERLYQAGKLDHITDWSLTGPLVHEYCITLDTYNPANEGKVSSWFCSQYGNHETDLSDNPLRAICECVLMLRMKK